MNKQPGIQIIATMTILLAGCSSADRKSQLERLADYEGKYEYSNPASLELAVSNFETTLYAITDDAQYPLKYISRDTFESPQKTPIVFQRDKVNEVNGYFTEGKVFKRFAKIVEKRESFRRKELYTNADVLPVRKDHPSERNDPQIHIKSAVMKALAVWGANGK